MLEAIVALRRGNHGEGEIGESDKPWAGKFTGDILAVKRKPCEWGTEEWRLFRIIDLEDDELEQDMVNKKEYVRPTPYMEIDPETGKTVFSTVRVKLEDFDWDTEDVIADRKAKKSSKPRNKTHLKKSELYLDMTRARDLPDMPSIACTGVKSWNKPKKEQSG